MVDNHDPHLVEVKHSVCELLFESGGDKQTFTKINKLYSDIENSKDPKQTRELIDELKDIIVANSVPLTKDASDKKILEVIQTNLAEYLKKKLNEAYDLAMYAKTSETGASPEELERLINDPTNNPLQEMSKFIARAEDMVDKDGKPKSLINHHLMFVEKITDEKGNVSYSISSQDPVSLIQNCIAMGKRDIVTKNFDDSFFNDGKSRKHIEDMFREANRNLYPINVEINYGTGQNAKNYPITGSGMMNKQSEEGKRLININTALKTVTDKNPNADRYEKTIATYAFLLDEGKNVEAAMFLEQQRQQHSKDDIYLHNLNVQALKQSDPTNPHKGYNYETFCKAMSLNHNITDLQAKTEAKNQAYQQHSKIVKNGGLLEKMVGNLESDMKFLPDENKEDFEKALLVLANKLVALQTNLVNSHTAGTYDIKQTETEIEDLKKSLEGLGSDLNKILEEKPELLVEEEMGPDNSPYSIDELTKSGYLREDYKERIDSLNAELARLNEEKNITFEKAQKISKSSENMEFVFSSLDIDEETTLSKNIDKLIKDSSVEEKKPKEPYSVEKLMKYEILPPDFKERLDQTQQELNELKEKSSLTLTPQIAKEKLERLINDDFEKDIFENHPIEENKKQEIEALTQLIDLRNEPKSTPSLGGSRD